MDDGQENPSSPFDFLGEDIWFGKKVRIVGAVMLCLGGILNMGLFLKVGAIFVQTIF